MQPSVWGTISHTTSSTSVENVITHCYNLQVTHTADTGKISCWFVIHADEAVLCELNSKWESVNLQTSWQLQTCLKPAVVIQEKTHTDDTGSLLEDKHTSETNEMTNEATTNNISTTNLPLPYGVHVDITYHVIFTGNCSLNTLFCLSQLIMVFVCCTDPLTVVNSLA